MVGSENSKVLLDFLSFVERCREFSRTVARFEERNADFENENKLLSSKLRAKEEVNETLQRRLSDLNSLIQGDKERHKNRRQKIITATFFDSVLWSQRSPSSLLVMWSRVCAFIVRNLHLHLDHWNCLPIRIKKTLEDLWWRLSYSHL